MKKRAKRYTRRQMQSLERKIGIERGRGNKFKTEVARLAHELVLERRKLDARYCEGAATMTAAIYQAVGDDRIVSWISRRLLNQRIRKPPFGLSKEAEAAARRGAIEELKKCGLDFLDGEGRTDVVRALAL